MSLRVWATRPAAQNTIWCETLRGHGFDVLDIPLMAINPVTNSEKTQAVKNAILSFDEYQKVIFVSQNAVEEAFRWLHDFWPQLPVGIEYFAVGKKTAECVIAHGVSVTSCNDGMNSEDLLSLPALNAVENEKILICRGCGGLPKIGLELKARGAFVKYCELYERGLPSEAPSLVQGIVSDEKSDMSNDIVALFSGETLQNFDSVLSLNQIVSRNMQLVVPGDRVAQLALSLGFLNVNVAVNASSDMMLNAILNLNAARQG